MYLPSVLRLYNPYLRTGVFVTRPRYCWNRRRLRNTNAGDRAYRVLSRALAREVAAGTVRLQDIRAATAIATAAFPSHHYIYGFLESSLSALSRGPGSSSLDAPDPLFVGGGFGFRIIACKADGGAAFARAKVYLQGLFTRTRLVQFGWKGASRHLDDVQRFRLRRAALHCAQHGIAVSKIPQGI